MCCGKKRPSIHSAGGPWLSEEGESTCRIISPEGWRDSSRTGAHPLNPRPPPSRHSMCTVARSSGPRPSRTTANPTQRAYGSGDPKIVGTISGSTLLFYLPFFLSFRVGFNIKTLFSLITIYSFVFHGKVVGPVPIY